MYPQALSGCLILLSAWGYFFWSSWSLYFNPNSIPISVFLFNIGIVGICAYIVSEKMFDFRKAGGSFSQIGLLSLFMIISAWIMLGNTEYAELQKPLSLLMLPAILLSTFGLYVARFYFFPLLYFLLIIPFFEYSSQGKIFILWLAFSLLFAYLRYKDFSYRLTFISLGILTPTLLHEWQMDSYISSLIGVILLLTLGYFFKEPRRIYHTQDRVPLENHRIQKRARWWLPTAIAFVLMAIAPWLKDNIRPFYPTQQKSIALLAPIATGEWQGPKILTKKVGFPWKTQSVPSAAIQVQYSNKQYSNKTYPSVVSLHAAYYPSVQGLVEILKSQDVMFNDFDDASWKKAAMQEQKVQNAGNTNLTVLETLLERNGKTQLIWSWYFVLGISSVEPKWIKMLDKIHSLSRYADGSGLIVLSTEADSLEQARNQLASFLKEMYPALEILKRPEKIS